MADRKFLKRTIPIVLILGIGAFVVENLMSAIRRATRRVSRWRNGSMIRRWVGVAILDAKKRSRRLKGHRDMPLLLEALNHSRRDRLASTTDAA